MFDIGLQECTEFWNPTDELILDPLPPSRQVVLAAISQCSVWGKVRGVEDRVKRAEGVYPDCQTRHARQGIVGPWIVVCPAWRVIAMPRRAICWE
jgi:hypothetical protein